ncbi:MAG: tetratricopeptide repeat protein, partial [Planctomycetaceae bacterium]|nr:tetratricopeptide repeat protein [Planctomycetaceae bacterium]
LKLFDKWSVAMRSGGSDSTAFKVARAIAQLMGINGEAKRHVDCLNLLDHFLDHHLAMRRLHRPQPAARQNRTPGMPGMLAGRLHYIWYGKQEINVRMTFPTSRTYYDDPALTVLRTAFEAFRRNEELPELQTHFVQRLEKAVGGDRLYEHLALGYLNWWNDEQDAAVQQLIAASQLAGQDWQLKLEVAQLQVELQQFNDALALVDTMPAIDQESLRERELLALNLATRLGDSDRARQAAERLFGLRLDGPTQLNLARQMQQLGMRDQAEAVLSRVQNQASGQLPSLVEIMQSHQASGREELAAQIALQIVRKSPASQTPPPRSPTRVGSVNGVAKSPRTLAFEVLKKSGKLKELISITEEQLQRSPKSGQLVALLSEYYTADGNPQQALKAELRLLESKPDDVSLRLRYTRKLISSGDLNEACEHYLLLIKAQPDLLRTEFVNISVAFASAKRVPEFVKVLEEIDIHQLPSRPETMRLVRLLFSAPGQHAAGIALLKRLSSAFPDSRNELFNDLTFDEHIWVVPEIYELGKKSLFPVAGRLQNDPWTGFSRVIIVQSANNTFGVTNMTRRILDAAAELNKLPELQSEIAEQVEAFPDWKLGPLLIALIDVRLGQIDAARPTLERLATLKNSADSPYGVRWNVGQELETNNELLPLSIRFYERALEIGPDRNIRSDFAYGPGSRLLKLYIKLGQREQALKLLGTMEKQSQAGSGDPRLAAAYAQQKTQTLFSIAAEYENLDSLLNAARLYRRILNEPVTNETTFASNVRSVESTVSQAKSHWNRLMAKLATSQDLDWTDALLTPNAPVDKPALDLMLELRSNPNGMPRIESQLNELLSRQKPTPQVLAAMRDRFRELERQRPQDLSVLIVDALSALAANDRPQSIAALANLEAFLDRTPLEPLMQGKLPNSRQRNTALHQVALWLVASKCLQRDEYLADGQLLAARALEASKRQSETSHAIAIHYELAQHALLSKDVTAAEQHLSELLTLVLPPFQVKKFGRSTLTESAQVPANSGQRATPTNPVDSGRLVQSTPNVDAGQSVYPVTYTQFRQSMVVADLALENQMLALAGRAMRESLAGGFLVADPVVNQNVSGSSGPVRSSPRVMTTLSVPTGPSTPTNVVPARVAKPVGKPVVIDESLFNNSVSTISSRLLAISNAWREKGHPPQEIYAAFKDIVLPKSRREEIVLYEQTLTKLQSPKSLGHELVLWSVAANEVDALRKEIAARNSNPSSLLKGNVLLVQLAIASNETAGAVQPLKLLAELVKADPQIRTVTTAAQAASVAMTRTELAMDAAPVLVAGLPILSKQNPNEADHVRSLLTRYYLAQHKTDELRTLIDEQLEAKRNQYGPNLDYVNYKQRIELTTLIDAIAPHTEFPLLLEYLGRLTDLPVSQNYGEPAARTAALSTPLWYFAWHLRALTPDTRYALLKDSTLPNENRKSLRYFSGFLRGRQAPVSFLTPREIALGPPPQIGLASNFSLLVEAAGKAGRLDELQVLADQAVTEKLPHAEGLSVLVAIARGDRDANLKLNLFLDASRKRVKTLVRNDMNVSTYAESRLLDLEIAAVAQTSDLTFNTGREFATAVLRENQAVEQQSRLPNARLPHAGWVVAQGAMHGLTPPDQERLRQPNLRLWRPGNPPLNTHNSRPPAWWVAEAGHVVCLGGFEAESLIFRYPLTGSFEFSAEVHSSNFSEGSLGYGGLVTEPQVRDKDVQIWPISRHEFVQRGAIPVAENHWNRYSVRVTPQAIRFYCNGHLAYEELAPSATSPWLSLQGLYYRRSVFRNLQLTGEPQIPRQVELILDDRREGWDEAEGEQTAPRLLNRELPENLFARRALQQNEGRPVDWHVESSILNGRYDAAAPEFTQGCFRYFRPLHNGEQLKYEFLYEPGKTHVHPAIGSLAMLLEPAGVRVHWLALDPVDTEGLEPGNVADEPQNRRGPANLPLKPGMWNQVEISTAGETMRLKLNGELVFERPVESVNSRQFALFHYRNLTAAKVRNVVLSGNWPAKMTPQELSNLLVPENPEESVSLRRARHLLIHEEKFVDSAYQVAIAARGMAPEQRYEMLREWVLPVPTHPTLRLQAGFTPVDPPLVTAAEAISKLKGTRQHLGGELVAPAMELVRTATELKRLKELEQAILAAQREVPEISRDHQALKIMLACAQGDESAASIGFKSLMESMKSRDPAMPQEIPFAELLALRAMLDRPSVRLEVAEQAKTHLDSNRQVGEWDSSWRAMLHAAVNNAQSQGQVPSRLSQWTTVSHLTAQSRAKGERPADWQGARGQARFLAGNGDTALYFQSPLAGNLELRMRKTTSSTGEIRPMYACIGIELKDDHEWFMRRMQGRARTREFPKKLEFKSATADYRLVVQDREYTVYVNETKVHTETLTADIDPWLSIQTTQARSDGTVEDIQILGTPTVPE